LHLITPKSSSHTLLNKIIQRISIIIIIPSSSEFLLLLPVPRIPKRYYEQYTKHIRNNPVISKLTIIFKGNNSAVSGIELG